MVIVWLIPFFAVGTEWGQRAQGQVGNLMSFDEKLLHYGIQVGISRSKFDIDFTTNDEVRRQAIGAASYYNEGFHVAIVGDLRLCRFFNLRFLPGITLIDRDIQYTWAPDYRATHLLIENSRTVESVYGDLPLEIKFRAMRWHNFRPYITGGGSYSFDFASLRKNKNNNDESIIKLNASEFRYTVGVGADFFLRYVKFAIEIKMAFGINGLQVHDEDIYTDAIDGIHSRTMMVSFTFEG